MRLGYSESDVGRIPRCVDLPAVPNSSAGLGCLYVLEGATLGGQVVRRELLNRYGLGPGTGCSFFSSHRERAGEMWKEFCAALSAYADRNPGIEGPVVAAAAETFTRLDEWLAGGAGC